MASHIGNINEFDHNKEDFYIYKKRLEVWMKVNKIKAEDKANVFLALVGSHVFEIITNMSAPVDPSTKTYDQLVAIAEKHFEVTRNTVTERVRFLERKLLCDTVASSTVSRTHRE